MTRRSSKNRTIIAITLSSLFIAVFSMATFGQDEPIRQTHSDDPDRQRPMILRQLGLTQEQIDQFRVVNAEWRPVRMEAQRRFREANRDLDLAIYADVVDDALVAERLRVYQEAQAELTRIRYAEEVAVRKILTPEQLIRFREARRRFAQAREDLQRRQMQAPGRQPARPLNRQPERQMPQQRPEQRPEQRPQQRQP